MTPSPLLACAAREPRMFYVYALRSLKTGLCYLGWTSDLGRRLAEHNNGGALATRNRGPYELVYYEAYRHREEAMMREKLLKQNPRRLKQLRERLFRTLASSRPKAGKG